MCKGENIMLDKIIKIFFDKTKSNEKSKIITIKRRASNNENCTHNEKTQIKYVETSLSKFFKERRGLNLIERGFTYCDKKNICLVD